MTTASDEEGDRRLAVEACRLHERYTVEVIERWNLCPWAWKARQEGEVARRALLQRDADPRPTLDLLAELEGATPRVVVMIAIYPRLALDPRAFDAFVSSVKALDQARHGGRPVYVSASFHPDYALDDRSPSALVPWLRRSPDPSLQLVHFATIEEARGRTGKILFDYSPEAWEEIRRRIERGTVPERVAADNHATVANDREEMERAVADIAADRARSYAGLL